MPVVVTQHNHVTTAARYGPGGKEALVPWLARALYPWADRVVAVSEGVADDLAATARLPGARIDVVYNPVDVDRIAESAAEPVAHPWLADRTGPVLVAAGG